jgi:CheY-like chemotaxis protein
MFEEHFFNILMIDDDPDDHEIFRDSLRKIELDGLRLSEIVKMVSLYTGADALSYLLKKANYKDNEDVLPDFIVLDLNMPLIDGFTVLKEIQAHATLKQIPVYILTTSKDEQQKQKCLALQCAGFFSKPSASEGLKSIFEQMLNVCPD